MVRQSRKATKAYTTMVFLETLSLFVSDMSSTRWSATLKPRRLHLRYGDSISMAMPYIACLPTQPLILPRLLPIKKRP